MAVEISNRQRRIRLDRSEIAELAAATLEAEGKPADVSIAFVNSKTITDLNRRYFGRDNPTDVIAFPLQDDLGDDSAYLGEAVICADVAADEARTRGIDPTDELYLYTVHGLLHLLGHTDDTPAKRTAMNRRARSIVRRFLGRRKDGKRG
ncbi:MAG TPA: rRNA maturation RNase YbeY [Planctomycetota bacterium]|nr:rRNA maturation RNase YbeY [Planctomycetota bacterium]